MQFGIEGGEKWSLGIAQHLDGFECASRPGASGLSGDLRVTQTLLDEKQLPNEQSRLNSGHYEQSCCENCQEERIESSGVVGCPLPPLREHLPFIVAFGTLIGVFIGSAYGMILLILATRGLKRLNRKRHVDERGDCS